MPEYTYYQSILENQHYPLAFVDMELFDQNIREVLNRNQSDKTIRVATKSVRVPELIKYILDKADNIQGLMSYSATEALFLSQQGFDDILIAYPVVDKTVIEPLLLEIKSGKKIYFMVDSIEHCTLLSQLGSVVGVSVPVCLDIDLSHSYFGIYFGVYRSKLNSMERVKDLVKKVSNLEHISIKGVMGYEAQIAGIPDTSPVRNFVLNYIVRRFKSSSIGKIDTYRTQVIDYLEDQEIILDFVNGGGTGSMESTIKEHKVTEVTVGSGFFSPVLFDYYNNFRHQPAMAFAIQITRKPKDDVYTCHGGGYIASGGIGIDKQPKPYLPEDVKLFPDEGLGEVQTPISSKYPLEIGDPVLFRHAKAGELCEHFNEILLLRNGEIEKKTQTYRGLGKKFL